MKNSIKLLHCVIIVSFLFSFALVKDNGPIDLIIANLNSYTTTYSPNKIYLQTDRSIYALEDTIWFKTYAIDATHHFPAAKSKVIYVDLVDSNGNKLVGKKFYAENLGAASDIYIEREWLPGRYKLRAYTKYMLNQEQEYIYNKEIQIVDINKAYDDIFSAPKSNDSEKATISSPSLDMNFFPEGGDLIAGINSRVAIKIENYSADLGNITGAIEDKSGNLVVPFKVFEKGYGLASFTPKKGKKYFAKLDNDPKIYPLPEIKSRGYNITVFNKPDIVSFIISTNVESGLSDGDILIHSRGQLIYHEKLSKDIGESYALKLNTKEMPTGVTQITFFNRNGIPQSERLFFVDNDISESVIKTDKTIYSKRENVDLSLSINNSDLKAYDCSISVFDKSNLQASRPADNIKSWMLLNSDLRGEIVDPAFYFDKSGDHKSSYLLDLVMMTHGWRRFTWADMSKEDIMQDLEYEREEGLYVRGYTSKLLNSRKGIKSNVMLNFLNTDLDQSNVVTDEEGQFAFGPFVIKDSVSAIIQARRFDDQEEKEFLDGNRKLNINLENPRYLVLDKPIFKEGGDFDYSAYKTFVANNRSSQALKDQYHSMEVTLSEIVLTAKKKTQEEEMSNIAREKSIYSNPSNRVIVEEHERSRYISLFDMLREVPGITIQGAFPNQSIFIRGLSSINLTNTPIFLIDGVPVDEEFISQISPSEVLFIDILKGSQAAIFGSRGGNGVIAVYTGRNLDSSVRTRKPGIIDIVINGFDKNRQFYSPDHSINVSSVYEPDVRTTLYWNPYVFLANGEESTYSFFTADNTGSYVVVTEGLSNDGEPIYGSYEFSVQENE